MTKFAGNMAALKLLTMMVILQTSSAAFYESVNRTVAFTVRFTSGDIDYGVTTRNNHTLKFDHVITNIGEGYDFLTGIFTAPFAGVYVFYLTAMSTNAIGEIVLAIEKNDTVLGMVFATGSSDQGSNLLTTELDTGEGVWVRQHYGDAVRGETWTAFTGFLILMY